MESGERPSEHFRPEGGEAPRSSSADHEDSFWSAALAIETEEKAAGGASILRATSARASTDVLSRVARQGKTRLVRAEAIFALVRRDTPEADAELLRVFRDGPGVYERRTVLAGLGAQGNPRHLALLDALRHEAGDGQAEEYRRCRSRVLGEGN